MLKMYTQFVFVFYINSKFGKVFNKIYSSEYVTQAYTPTVQICDATGCFVKALLMGQNIVLDKSYTKQLGQISILKQYLYS